MQASVEAQHVVDYVYDGAWIRAQAAHDVAHRPRGGARRQQVGGVEVGVEPATDALHRPLDTAHLGAGADLGVARQRRQRRAGLLDHRGGQPGRRRDGDPDERELSYHRHVPSHATTVIQAFALCILAGTAVARAEDGVRITLTGPQVPFATVEYAVEVKRGTVVAEYSKRFAARFGHLDKVAVLTRPDLDALLATLAQDGLWSLRNRRRKGAATRWVIRARQGKRTVEVTVDDPALHLGGAHFEIIERVRARVEAEVGRSIFQDAMLLRTEGGTLNLFTRPAARVRLDGVLLGATTPIRGLRVEAGTRKVELLPVGGSAPVTHDVRVEAGRATSLNLTLE